MKRKIILLLVVLLAIIAALAWQFFYTDSSVKRLAITVPEQVGEFDHSHALFTQVLRDTVENERVNYTAIKGNPENLRAYLGMLAAVDERAFDSWKKDQRLAYLINLYNASTIALVVQNYPLESIKDIGTVIKGPWDQSVVHLFGEMVTLNHIEHELIRAKYDEPRAHFGLVCASVGCPPLRDEAFVAERLSDQMDEQARIFFATESKNSLDKRAKVFHLSPIFKWFSEDFTSKAGSLEKFVAPYFPESDRSLILGGGLEIEYTSYDWLLNEQK